ncbi:hypothetical protein HYT02_03465 [Candidatus Gottesmanbacteria bacterium]|nr:hypothetical protein [Candidatus Gottesmanbacteria bacterium]
MRYSSVSFGFTIIEIIVVVIIMLILMGVGIAGYNNFNQSQVLKQTAEDIKSALRDAQNRALTSEKDENICTTALSSYDLDHWRFSITANNTYQISGSCGSLTFNTKTYKTPTNITLSPTSGNVDFKPLGQGVTQGSLQTITLISSVTLKKIDITITTSGNITVGTIY